MPEYLSFVELASLLYLVFLFLLTLMSLSYYFAALSTFLKKRKCEAQKLERFPKVCVMIPVYNDPIVKRCVEACKRFRYPNFEILVADDSTDPKTRELVNSLGVKVVRRNSRKGFKAGALNEALKHTDAEVIVVFDADFVPPEDFLEKIVAELENSGVAFVQARWKIENLSENAITLFAGTALLVYHNLFYPLQKEAGTVFMGGSALAIRREILEKVGGWGEGLLAEDAELTLRLAEKGIFGTYTSVTSALAQVPYTLKSFLRQQRRWCAGMLEALVLRIKGILKAPISLRKKLMLLYIPLGNLIYPVTAAYITLGVLFWIAEKAVFPPHLILLVTLLTSGYLFAGAVILAECGEKKKIPLFVASVFILGSLLAFSNTYAIVRRMFGKMEWYRTEKRVRAC